MTFSDKDRSRTLALVRDVAECELEFSIENVCAVLGCDRHFPKYSWLRIADLIDPDCGTQEADSSPVPEHNADLSKMVDRDALLRLARYMDKDVAETEAHFSNVISTKSVSDYARRIREACGEVWR